jgi:hypothetical protein
MVTTWPGQAQRILYICTPVPKYRLFYTEIAQGTISVGWMYLQFRVGVWAEALDVALTVRTPAAD